MLSFISTLKIGSDAVPILQIRKEGSEKIKRVSHGTEM